MSEFAGLLRVTLPDACFGLVVKHGIVYESAPYGRRASLGKNADVVCRHWQHKGATIEVVL